MWACLHEFMCTTHVQVLKVRVVWTETVLIQCVTLGPWLVGLWKDLEVALLEEVWGWL